MTRITLNIPRLPRAHSSNLSTFAVCAAILATLMLWVVFWPQTGDGDAITHFLAARDAFHNPTWLMSAWARVGSKLLLLVPAHFGMLPTRWVCALIATICAWQTIRLADDLEIPHAVLAAPMMIFQPLVFEHAADTMTEVPFALGLVIAIRLFWARRWLASAMVVSYLPTVRPEGFFLCAFWGILILITPHIGKIRKRIIFCAALSSGTICWAIACWIITGKPNYFLNEGWTWHATESPFGHGSLFWYVLQWPAYCGHVLLVLFLLGLGPLWKKPFWCIAGIMIIALELALRAFGDRLPPLPTHMIMLENWLPLPALVIMLALALTRWGEKFTVAWWAFCLIFLLHSILWWRGWFASQGLLRILGCVAPITAIICLLGFNVLAGWLARLQTPLPLRRTLASAVVTGIVLIAFQYYAELPTHYRIFGVRAAVQFANANHLFESAPVLFLRDPIAQPEIPIPPNSQIKIISRDEPNRERQELLNAPIGSTGIWDDQHTGEPDNVDIQNLPDLGYTILKRFDQSVPFGFARIIGTGNATQRQTYVVIRKDH